MSVALNHVGFRAHEHRGFMNKKLGPWSHMSRETMNPTWFMVAGTGFEPATFRLCFTTSVFTAPATK